MRPVVALSLLFIVWISAYCQASAAQMTLEDVLSTVYLTNPQLEAERAALRGTDEEVAKALAGWRPSVGIAGSYGWQRQSQTLLGPQTVNSVPQSAQVTLSQPLFDGRTIPSTTHAKDLVAAGRAHLTATEQTVLMNAAAAYFSVLRDMEAVAAYDDDIGHLQQILKNTEARLRLGELTRTDASQARARLLGSQLALETARQQLASSRAAFEHVVGRPAETLVAHPAPSLPGDQERALDIAVAQNPSLLQSKAEALAAEHNVDVAVGALLPSLSVNAQYGRSIDQVAPGIRENGVSVIGRLNIPIYQGGAEEASIRQAKQQKAQATLLTHEAERQVRDDFATAWSALTASRASAELSIKQAEANSVAFQGTTMESQVGGRNIIDILNADQELLQSRLTAITQQQNSVSAAYKVLTVMGRMTATDLKLPVALYDPARHYNENASKWFGFGD